MFEKYETIWHDEGNLFRKIGAIPARDVKKVITQPFILQAENPDLKPEETANMLPAEFVNICMAKNFHGLATYLQSNEVDWLKGNIQIASKT